MFKENRRIFTMLLKCADVALELFCIFVAYELRFSVLNGIAGAVGLNHYMRMMLVAVPVYFLLYQSFELYDIFHYKSMVTETGKVVVANLCGAAFLFLLSFFLRQVDVSRLMVLFFAGMNTVLTAGLRITIRLWLRSARRRGGAQTRILIAGWNEMAGEFYDKITADLNFGYEVIGYLSDHPAQTGDRKIVHMGKLERLEPILQQGGLDEVIIALDYEEFRRLGGVIEACEWEGVKSSLLPFYAKYLPANPYVDELGGMPLINLHRIPLDNVVHRMLKRGFDLVVSLLLLVVLSPLMAGTALVIRLSSPGPVIYRQQRIGRNKTEFMMYKFRSMQVEGNADTTTWGTCNDSRRTRFGTLIRKFSIDELPQLFNVLKGEMSLVGPRPERPFFVEKFRDEVPLYMLKHRVRPGITGWAQVNGWRGDTSILERIKCDLFYIENWSFLMDIKILCLTAAGGIVNPSEKL